MYFPTPIALWISGNKGVTEIKKRDDVYDAKLKYLVAYYDSADQCLILCVKNIYDWMNAWGTTVTGTVLAVTGFCYFLCARYNITPPNLQSKYNGYGASFGVCHVLSFIKGGLIITRRKELRDNLLYLSQQARTSVKQIVNRVAPPSPPRFHTACVISKAADG